MTVDCTAVCENRFADYRDKGEQGDIYLGLKKPLEKVHHRRLKRNANRQPDTKKSHN